MKHYSTFAIEQFGKHIHGDVEAFNWLMSNDYRELIAVIDAIRDDKKAFKFLIEGNHMVLAAFVNKIWDDLKAFKFYWRFELSSSMSKSYLLVTIPNL